MNWQKIKIGSFLKERKDRFKPVEANKLGLKRIEKIDFSGNIHIVEKETNTGMILVKNGDLIISGINVEKGALAVYEGQEDVLATIHYSSYEYDKNKIDIEYLKWFLKSNIFRNILLEQVGGGIKTELKPKRFLPLEVYLPDLPTQIKIRNKIIAVEQEIDEVENRINQEQIYLTKLKEAILQEAVQGKLVEQDPNDEPASILLEKIKKEKEQLIKEKKIKKEKPLPEITQDEIPYELPNGWEWVRLGEILNVKSSKRIFASDYVKEGVPFFRSKEVGELGLGKEVSSELYIKRKKYEEIRLDFGIPKEGDILLACIGGSIGNLWLVDNREFYYKDGNLVQIDKNDFLFNLYVLNYLRSNSFYENALGKVSGSAYNALTIIKIKNSLFPLPPLEEQKRIVKKVDQLMSYCDELEQEINKSKQQAEQLMQSVLKEAFEQKEELLVEN